MCIYFTIYSIIINYCNTAGSCSVAGFNRCCVSGSCKGEPPNCYCDHLCRTFKDCCPDADTLCQKNKISGMKSSDAEIGFYHTFVHTKRSRIRI